MLRFAFFLVFAALGLTTIPVRADDQVARGEYLFRAGGCFGCHTAPGGAPLAGGRALVTPMGTFYGPNITPDPEHGIGRWTDEEFVRALHRGVGRSGEQLYPVFPYPSFTKITDADAKAIKAYIFTLPPSSQPSKPHDVPFPFNIRLLLVGWKWLNFSPGVFKPDQAKTPEWNRGAYLVEALAHCGECHTPRNPMGGTERSRALSGTAEGPDMKPAPNITPDPETGIGKWNQNDLAYFLESGIDPGGDVAGSVMDEVIQNTTSKLTPDDRRAIAAYVLSLPPVVHKVDRK
ncbi:MAG: cytochrome c [Alphaproteobacteria bacterium]